MELHLEMQVTVASAQLVLTGKVHEEARGPNYTQPANLSMMSSCEYNHFGPTTSDEQPKEQNWRGITYPQKN